MHLCTTVVSNKDPFSEMCMVFHALNAIQHKRMEGQSKASFNVMEGSERKGRDLFGSCDMVLRLLAFLLTLVATVVIGADKQTTIVSVKLVDSMPPLDVSVVAKWHYLSALQMRVTNFDACTSYFVGANAIACAYATLSLLVILANRRKGKGMEALITVIDALMVALLFSANGAAIAVGLLGFQGNSHVHWNKVCNVFGKFCDQVAASLFISLLGSITFLLLLVVPPVLRLNSLARFVSKTKNLIFTGSNEMEINRSGIIKTKKSRESILGLNLTNYLFINSLPCPRHVNHRLGAYGTTIPDSYILPSHIHSVTPYIIIEEFAYVAVIFSHSDTTICANLSNLQKQK
ncbi:hypothetical protein CR513_49785, partial [Mucuna pruriens]